MTVSVASLLGPAAQASTAAAEATGSAAPAGWTQLNRLPLVDDAQPDISRVGDQYIVQWTEKAGPDGEVLVSRRLSRSGSPIGQAARIVRLRSITSHALVSRGNQVTTLFAGINGTATPPGDGSLYASVSTDAGASWTLRPGSFGDGVFGSEGLDAADAGGAVVPVWTASRSIAYRLGLTSPTLTTADTGGLTYDPGVAYDRGSRRTWAAWYTLQGGRKGINVTRLAAGRGPILRAPRSADGQPIQKVPIVARTPGQGGGVFVAYQAGTVASPRVALWRVGSRTATTIPAPSPVSISAAVGPQGRIWVMWRESNSTLLRFARSNPAGTRLGAVGAIPSPPGAGRLTWHTAGNADTGRLQFVVTARHQATNTDRLYTRKVQPWLDAAVRPRVISYARGGKVTVIVTDAGAPLVRAVVKYGRIVRRTDAHGRVVLSIPRHSRRGRHTIVVSAPGYTGRAVFFAVR